MHSTNQVIKFVLIMTTVVALTLAGLFTFLKPVHEANEALYNKKAILSAVASKLDTPLSEMSAEQIENLFANSIEQKVVKLNGEEVSEADVIAAGYKGGKAEHVKIRKEKKKSDGDRILPFYTYTNSKGEKSYIVSVVGNGLWDEIWGNIALESNGSTIAGVAFDHQGETPGLGAEIKDNTSWKRNFTGKELYAANGEFKSIDVVKGGSKGGPHEVDGISGATITADGVAEMLERGLAYYQPYFEKIKK